MAMELNAHSLITLLQAMQLVALAPCVFIIVFLLLSGRDYRRIAVPCFYFTALAASFILPLLWPAPYGGEGQEGGFFYGGLIFLQSLLPALSFLLIIQFASGGVPKPVYWLILALPLIGGSGVVYASLIADELCLQAMGCLPSGEVEGLYATLSNAVIFLLLMAIFIRTGKQHAQASQQSRNEYWLIVALIGLNLISIALGLAALNGTVMAANALFIHTVLRMTFIYVVLTLLFRVFDKPLAAAEADEPRQSRSPAQQQRDDEVIAAFEQLMKERQLYREMGCSRESVARMLGVNENTLSRIINQHYEARFTDIVNQYRLKEAQRLLVAMPDKAITDIAFEVGFNSIPSFNRVFKEHSGFSPSAFRATRLKLRRG